MKKLVLITLLFVLQLPNILCQSQIIYNIVEKQWNAATLTWQFDLEARGNTEYVGQDNNWQAFNIRFDVSLPAGSIVSAQIVSTNPTYMSSGGGSINPAGGIPGQKFGISGVRNPANDLPTNNFIYLGTYSVTFNQVVDLSSIVTPRTASNSAGSFWTNTSPGNRPFSHPAAFPLPIKLHTFSAEKDGDRSARLDWATSSEVNSAYFGIERSKDGNTWERIGQVAAAGNSQSEQTYTYVDRNLPMVRDRDNVYYYRLQMTDLDGAYNHSDIRGVNLGKFAGAEVSIYPNPTVDMIHVDVYGISLEEGEVSLSVYDMNGRNMVSKNIIGSGIEVIDAAQYPAGTYDVVVKQGPNIYQKKVIKID